MNKKELRYWMNLYHDNWIEEHNKLINIQHVLDGITQEDMDKIKENECND